MKAYLLPNQHTILVKTGANYGISTLVRRRKFKGQFMKPIRFDRSEIWIYPDYTVRNSQGKYLGKYLGHEQDRFRGTIIGQSQYGGMSHDIIIRFEIAGRIQITKDTFLHPNGLFLDVEQVGEIHAICDTYLRGGPLTPFDVIRMKCGWEQWDQLKDHFQTNKVESKFMQFVSETPRCLVDAARYFSTL